MRTAPDTRYPPKSRSSRSSPQSYDERRARLQAKRAQMPIIDVTREPWEQVFRRWQRHALPYYLWFRFLRPLLLTTVWLGVLVYIWRHVELFNEDPGALPELGIYGVLVLVVALAVVTYAAVRGKARPRKYKKHTETSVREVAEFAALPTQFLSDWQDLPIVTVEHDARGRILDARTANPGETRPAPLDSAASSSALPTGGDSRSSSLKRRRKSQFPSSSSSANNSR